MPSGLGGREMASPMKASFLPQAKPPLRRRHTARLWLGVKPLPRPWGCFFPGTRLWKANIQPQDGDEHLPVLSVLGLAAAAADSSGPCSGQAALAGPSRAGPGSAEAAGPAKTRAGEKVRCHGWDRSP